MILTCYLFDLLIHIILLHTFHVYSYHFFHVQFLKSGGGNPEHIKTITKPLSSFSVIFQIFRHSTCCLKQLTGHLFLPNNISWLLGSKTKKMENFWKKYQAGSCRYSQVNHLNLQGLACSSTCDEFWAPKNVWVKINSF